MKVKQFRYSQDNLGYLVYGSKTAIAIDPGAVSEMISFAKEKKVKIKYVTNTHSHHDHTSGNDLMLEKTHAQFLDCKAIQNKRSLKLDDEDLLVFHTPGHTKDSLTFKADNILITGDTLFNGTIGNCFSEDLLGFFNSLKFLCSFPKETIIYGGHDYVKDSMVYAKLIDKQNPETDRYLEKYNPDHIISTLEDELKVNPYIRFNDKAMVKVLNEKNLSGNTEYERFKSIYELY
ncbi:MAG: MBL fold metallo-hydrolase [Deltaproteobacteria bacterium]|nr:MBL fold metallo-hydrolase [Deltaproteobacteria bacterium]